MGGGSADRGRIKEGKKGGERENKRGLGSDCRGEKRKKKKKGKKFLSEVGL